MRHATCKRRLEVDPSDPKPRIRERLFALGPSALSEAELLALLLGGGRAHTRALVLLQHAGGLVRMQAADAWALLDCPGIGDASACRVVAAMELARRTAAEELVGASFAASSATLRPLLARLCGSRANELVWVLGVDHAHAVACIRIVAHGTQNRAALTPRDVLTPVVAAGLPACAVVHNHPGGSPTPSAADEAFTRRVHAAAEVLGVCLLDHFIVGAGSVVSLREWGTAFAEAEEA